MDYLQQIREYDPDSDPEVQRLLAAIAELEDNVVRKGQQKPRTRTTAAKINVLKVELQKAQQLARELHQAFIEHAGHAKADISPRSSMSVSEDARPTSPLTSAPSSKAGSPQLNAQSISTAAVDSTDNYTVRSATAERSTPIASELPGNDSEQAIGDMSGPSMDDGHPNTTHQVMNSGASNFNIVDRCASMSSQMRTMNARYDAAERSKELRPYESELNRVFGTPPKPPQQWTGGWGFQVDPFYLAPHRNFGSHTIDASHGSASSGTSDFAINNHAMMNLDTHAPIETTHSTEFPSNVNMQNHSLVQNGAHYTFGEDQGHRFQAADVDMLDSNVNVKKAPGSQTSELALRVGGSFHEINMTELDAKAEGESGSHALDPTPALRGSGGRTLRGEGTRASRGGGTRASHGGSALPKVPSRVSAITRITGRPIPVDFSEIGVEQYCQDHGPWATYKDRDTDRNAYLRELVHSPFKENPDVANQRPIGINKVGIFRMHEGGAPFESLGDEDHAILNTRGRVAIRSFIGELAQAKERAQARALAAELHGSNTDNDPLPAPRLVPNWVKKLALVNATYLPEAATTSTDVSLEFLTLSNRQIGCRYHIGDRFERGARDGIPVHKSRQNRGIVDLHGVPYDFVDVGVKAVEGHAHCGCSLADILLDWHLFKTRGAKSTKDDPEFKGETFYQYTSIAPTPRAYYHATFTALTGLNGFSKALYTGIEGWGLVPGDWKTPQYDFDFNMAVLTHTFSEMNVDPRVLYGSKS